MTNYYECIMCNYKTKDRSNISHHNKTKKHLKNIINISIKPDLITSPPIQLPYTSHTNGLSIEKNQFQCDYCDRIFTRYDNLGRHIKSCESKKNYNNDKILTKRIKELSDELKLFKTKNEHYEDENEHYKEEATYYKQMLMEAGGLVKKSVSALTYSITNYNDAPHIKTIKMKDIKTFKSPNTDKHIVEDILSAYKHKTLNKYLGEIIIKLYKKDNPLDQSIWNTDDNRLTYIVKELLNNKASTWIVDKKGNKTAVYLINPLLKYVKGLIVFYQTNYTIPEINQNSVEVEMILENSKKIIDIINDIDDGVIAKDVLKYISTHLRFNEKSIK